MNMSEHNDVGTVRAVLAEAAGRVALEEKTFSEIDAETGDGDHGVTMAKICRIIEASSKTYSGDAIGELFSDISFELMMLNGGSAGSIWAAMFSQIAETAADTEHMEPAEIRRIFHAALDGVRLVSSAKPGEKTLIDVLVPAVEAADSAPDTVPGILDAAAEAAAEGAEKTRDMVAKYGRAKNLKEASLGHLDPGAVSMAAMIGALAEAAGKPVR